MLARRRVRLLCLGLVTLVLIVAGVTPAQAASTLGITKSASVTTAQPGDEFRYTIVPRCSGLTEACVDARFVDVLPAEVEVTALPTDNADRTVSYDPATRRLEIIYRIPLPAPSPPDSVGLPAGSSNNVEVGVRLPADTAVPDGAEIANTATVTAANAPTASDTAVVDVDVPRVARPVATKTWSDGSAVAGTDEESTITLGVRNASSSTAQMSSLTVEDANADTFDRFTVTGIGPVAFPPGADRVTVFACAEILSACSTGDYTAGPAQTGPALALPGGVDAEDVTGLRFVFSNAAGTPIPGSPDAGSVVISTVLRDTLRSSGETYSPTTRDDVVNCVSPSGDDPVLGTVSGSPACATYAVQPAQATMSLDKTFFADGNADYQENGQAVDGENSLVSGLVRATNTSPFAVAEITISEPSTTAQGEWDKFDVSSTRLVFPTGATRAEVQFDCGDSVIARTFSPPPTTVDAPVPCQSGRADGILATFSGLDANGEGTIRSGATATLGIQGRLNANVTAEDLVGGGSAGVQNCASGTATSSINGVGSAAAADCGSVPVQPAFSRLQGVKSAELPTILPGLPRTFSLSFTNNGTVPATGVTLVDPRDPNSTSNAFRSIRLESLTLPATPAATVEVYDPAVNDYVPYDAADAALLERSLGFRIRLTDPLPPGQRYAATARVLLRTGVDAGARIQNCASIGSDSQPGTDFCSAAITATEPSEGASVQKAISPATSVRPQPGLPGQTIQVKLAAQNTGTLWLKRLVVTDVDPDFFDAVDVTGTVRVNFPPSANRVRVDVCTTDCASGVFINGTRTASQTPALPAGVDPAAVRGFRITFSVADDSTTIKPGANFPVRGACTGASVCIDVRPRATLHSDPATGTNPGTAVPATLSDTASGGYETTRQDGQLADIPDSTATHELTSGTAALRFDKSPDTAAQPGEPIPFTLSLTNTGTGPLPDPVIVDPLPPELEFAPANPAAPYTFTITQPTGAPEPGRPDLDVTQEDTGRVTSLRWRFPGLELLPGGTVTVTFTAQLAPGVAAGDSILNRAGGSADRDDVACSDGGRRSGTAPDDDDYGDGLFCTSASQVTTLAGNAIRTEKWVAGEPGLGWMNALTGDLLPLDDETCPRLKVDDVSFTRYPCVARVAPGQGFDFYLRLTNGGTNPATEVRVVDVFPRSGDTGVILTGEQRGTQWQAPPTLLSDVRLTGTGVLDIGYSPDSTPCTTLLDRPPTDCPVGSWVDGRDSSTAAFAAAITFDGGGLRPGGSTALRFRMAAPPAPPEPSQNMVAWNSFAHTEFFSDGGRRVQLPATEPIKTGVALVFGDLTVRKVVVDSPATGPFGFTYRCVLRPEGPDGQPAAPVEVATGEFTLGAGESVRLTARPARATCAVWESDGSGLISDADGEANAKSADIPIGGEAEIPVLTITNRAAPSPSPTLTDSPSPSASPSSSPAPSDTATDSPSPSASPSSSPAPSDTATDSTPSGGDDDGGSDPDGDGGSDPDGDDGYDGVLSQTGASTAVTVVGAIAGLLVLGGIATLGVSIRRRRL